MSLGTKKAIFDTTLDPWKIALSVALRPMLLPELVLLVRVNLSPKIRSSVGRGVPTLSVASGKEMGFPLRVRNVHGVLQE